MTRQTGQQIKLDAMRERPSGRVPDPRGGKSVVMAQRKKPASEASTVRATTLPVLIRRQTEMVLGSLTTVGA